MIVGMLKREDLHFNLLQQIITQMKLLMVFFCILTMSCSKEFKPETIKLSRYSVHILAGGRCFVNILSDW